MYIYVDAVMLLICIIHIYVCDPGLTMHKGCSYGYKLDAYPQFSKINSQTVEQANSALKRIKASLSYMNAEHFMQHIQLYLWYRNISKEV